MAQEQLNLIDGMSPSLRRIYQEAERLNAKMLTLKANIKSLEKRGTLSYFRKELKDVERQAKLTEQSVQRMRVAFNRASKSGNFWFGKNGDGSLFITHGLQDRRYWTKLQHGQNNTAMMSWLANSESYASRYQTMLRANRFREMRNSPMWREVARMDMGLKKLGLSRHLNTLNSATQNLSSRFVNLASGITTLSYTIGIIKDIARNTFIEPQSQYISNLTRVALTNDGKKTPVEMMDALYDTANRTRAPIDATMMLYNRVALSGVKADNERIRRFVESFNKVTAISGTTGQENRAVMLQLAQGIGSNRLGGDEFRSISEQAPLFKYMLAKGLGVNPGALKEMGAQGKLTAEAILSAMEKVQDQIDEIFKDAPLTIDQAITILQNKWSRLINKQFTGYLAIRDLIKDITLWMDTPKGQETMTNLIRGWNKFLRDLANFIRKISPIILWILSHIKLIITAIGIWIGTMALLRASFIALQAVIAGIRLYEWFHSGVAGVAVLQKALQSLAQSFAITASIVVGKIALMLGALMVGWKIGTAIRGWSERQQENAIWDIKQQDIERAKKEKWRQYITENGILKDNLQVDKKGKLRFVDSKDLSATKAHEQYAKLYAQWEKDQWTPMEQKWREHHEKNIEELQVGKYAISPEERQEQELQKQLQAITGMADSSKNVPMVGKVKEVGKVNDKISIDTEDIEMMKSIAERQWVMQNEVTIPQNVPITITKEVELNEDELAEKITKGMRTAVVASMRGKAE